VSFIISINNKSSFITSIKYKTQNHIVAVLRLCLF